MRGAITRGNAIRQLRKSRGWTQDQLAKAACCDVKTVRKAESSGRLDNTTLNRLAKALNIEPVTIVERPTVGREQARGNLERVREWVHAFLARDVQRMLALYHDDATVTFPGRPDIPGIGTFRGKPELRRQAGRMLDCFQIEMGRTDDFRLYAVDDFVLLRDFVEATVRSNGARFESEVLHEFLFQDGKVIKHLGLLDTLVVAESVHQIVQD